MACADVLFIFQIAKFIEIASEKIGTVEILGGGNRLGACIGGRIVTVASEVVVNIAFIASVSLTRFAVTSVFVSSVVANATCCSIFTAVGGLPTIAFRVIGLLPSITFGNWGLLN